KVIKGPDERLNNGESATDKTIATKQPRIRIEFDDIADTPKVFIDGVEQDSVQHINLIWPKPDTEGDYAHGSCHIKMVDKQRRLHGIGQGK
ncbi:hypothetical protein, partial [Lactiplantibacillus pentosus]